KPPITRPLLLSSRRPRRLLSWRWPMEGNDFNQKAWLTRVGYRGSLEPTSTTLRDLVHAHAHAIAYESIDIMLGRPPVLEIGALQAKMIEGGRGGYCFEQNMLFRAGLRSLE